MQVLRATAMGMCFGVRDALEMTEQIAHPHRVTIHGELVHNEQIQETLRLRGFHQSDEAQRDAVPSTPFVVITAHGISTNEQRRLREANKQLIDTTCPLVRRVHQASQMLQSNGYFVVVIGRKGHVEVEGIVGDLQEYTIVQNVNDVTTYSAERIGIVCQTTTRPVDAERIRQTIEAHNPGKEIRYLDTICQPTKDRQLAIHELLEQIEALIVVGGRNSNNSKQLAELAHDRGVPAVLVQSANDLDAKWLARYTVVGLTAGTSTPDEVIEEVYTRLTNESCNNTSPKPGVGNQPLGTSGWSAR